MTSIYPELPQAIPAQAAETVGRVPAFDADRGRFLLRDGALLERSGVEAVKQWFELALRQQINRIPIYRTQEAKKYGVPRDLIGGKLPQGLAAAELERGGRPPAITRRCGRSGSCACPGTGGPAWWSSRRYCTPERAWR